MGMVVRTNMAAINANNSLQQASKAQQSGLQKLASGFKINKAADDASGLAISEKMKNQIKALDTAKDNCEDGANMIQTAEGYMAETHDILNRMVELSEKAANGTLGDEDRGSLQKEMDELCAEVDRIATTANFNGHKLLDGSIGGTESVKLTCDEAAKRINYTSPTLDRVNTVPTGKNYTVDASSLSGGKYTYKTDHWENEDGDTVAVTTGTAAAKGAKVTLDSTDGSNVVTSGGIKIHATTADKGKTVTFDGTDWKDTDGNVVAVVVNITGPADGDKFTVKEGINLQIGESSTAADRLEVSINSFHTDTLFGGIDGFINTTNNSDNTGATAAVKINTSNDSSTYNNAVSIDITDKDAASAAADAIRQISNYVSDERGKLGAQQNRLEHTVNNLTTASENTSAANSRIRDTDMAKEMMAYTSKNVIAQAAQSMLAQANSQPQNVLSLLQ